MKIILEIMVGISVFIFLPISVGIIFANPVHELLSQKTKKEREMFLTAYLQQSKENCDKVNKSFFQGFDKEKNAFWNVACDNNQSFSIMIENNSRGSTKILGCDVMKLIGAACWKKF